jgi:predicted phosphodiesterase
MLVAVFSDVHANIEALRAVLDYYKTLPIERYVYLGDAVGYGPNPNESCDLVRALAPLTAVLGNHDAAVSGKMPYDDYYDAARAALDWTTAEISPDNKAWLTRLPYKIREGELTFTHGSPIVPETFEYLLFPEQLLDLYDIWDELSPITFIGHSHLSIAFKIENEEVSPLFADSFVCRSENKYIITAGSVGQPRDRDPRACCCTFDTETRTFTYHRIEYDKLATRDKIIKAGLAPTFGERLLLGM